MHTAIWIFIVIIVIVAIIWYLLSDSEPEKIIKIHISPVQKFDKNVESNIATQNLIKRYLLMFGQIYHVNIIETMGEPKAYLRVETETDKKSKTFDMDQTNYIEIYKDAMEYMIDLAKTNGNLEQYALASTQIRLPDKLIPPEAEKITEVTYLLIYEFEKYPEYYKSVQSFLELELVRLCKNVNITPQQAFGNIGAHIIVKTNKRSIKFDYNDINMVEKFGECFLFINQFAKDITPFKGIDLIIEQIVYSEPNASNPIVKDLVKELSKPDRQYGFKNALQVRVVGDSKFVNYIKPQPKLDTFVNIIVKIDDVIIDNYIDLLTIDPKELKNKFLTKPIQDAHKIFENRHIIPLISGKVTVGEPINSTTQGMNSFKEDVRKYR